MFLKAFLCFLTLFTNVPRPETVESLFLAHRLTGDPKYRASGWKIFQAIEKYCRIDSGGYASIKNVDDVMTTHIDKMDTFFLVCRFLGFALSVLTRLFILCDTQAETLKYLYLLFADSQDISLDGMSIDSSFFKKN